MVKIFEDIVVWQKSHQLTLLIYNITKTFPRTEEFGLTSQMRRAAVSVSSNIVEGFKRATTKDSVHFYTIAEGSLEELKYQLLLARDLSYVNIDTYNDLKEKSNEVGKLLNGWKKSQKFF